jgi:uncharacterized protein YjbI with pentapeptide repeats
MLIICEPRFKFFDEEGVTELFITVNQAENQKLLRNEIVATLSDLFPEKVGDIEQVGNSVYGITVFESDEIDDEIQILNGYNAQKNNIEVRYDGKTHNAIVEFYTFMDRTEYPKNMILSPEDESEIQTNGIDLNGLRKLDNLFLTSADLSGVNLNGSSINNSSFNDSILVASQFTDSTVFKSDFNGADMRYANFSVATLTGVTLIDADLRRADFNGASLTNVNLSGADLRYADLTSVSFDETCILTGAIFINLEDVLSSMYEYPPNIFRDVNNVLETEPDHEEYSDEDAEEEREAEFLKGNQAIFSSANVNSGEDSYGNEDEADDDDENINSSQPICSDVINGYDINIQAYLDKSSTNFTIQLPNSDKYECVNLNDIKKYHIKTDKSGTKYFNYVYGCNNDTPYFAFSEGDYKRVKPYIRIGSFSLIVEKPEWFPQADVPVYRKFKLVKTGSEPSFVSETMLRHGEKGDPDYISSEWHCNAGKMDTYKLEPLLEGGRMISRSRSRMLKRSRLMTKRTKSKNKNNTKTKTKAKNTKAKAKHIKLTFIKLTKKNKKHKHKKYTIKKNKHKKYKL